MPYLVLDPNLGVAFSPSNGVVASIQREHHSARFAGSFASSLATAESNNVEAADLRAQGKRS